MRPARPRLAVFLLLESFWAAVVVALVAGWTGHSSDPAPGWLSSTAMLWGAYATVRFAGRLRVEADTAVAISLGIGVVTVAVVLRLTYAVDLLFWQPGVLLDFLQDMSGTYRLHPAGITGGLVLIGLWLRGGWLGRGGVIGIPPDDRTEVFEGKGCKECGQTGYQGRLGIFELMLMDEEVRRLILANSDATQLRKAAIQGGMISLRADGLEKVKQGITTISEVLRVTQDL